MQPPVTPAVGRVTAEPAVRADIQALRGLAIALVLLHHARLLPALKAGYLGVDVFFVVSGYLITGIVARGLRAGTFSFRDFYWRRVKRLLPAAYLTFAACVLAAPVFLTQPEMRDFVRQLAGAVTFTGNIALWLQTGYFEGAAHLKPLLHVWSLAIEEQYYLLLPAALAFMPQRWWKPLALLAVAASLALCLALVGPKPGATFYLLPTRAWELGLGSLGVLVLEGSRAGAWLARLFWPALAALMLVPFFPTGAPHPGLDALIVCTATLIVVLRKHPGAQRAWWLRPLVGLGDISYSLYLVHWPLLAFAANAWVSPVPGWVRLGLVVTAVLLAAAMYHWVEQPGRRAAWSPTGQRVALVVAASLGLVLMAFAMAVVQRSSSGVDFAQVRQANFGLNPACEFGDVYQPRPECQTSERPSVVLWGDSYAMQWGRALADGSEGGVMQATRSSCGPLRDVSFFRAEGWYNRAWAEKCIRFNDDVFSFLSRSPSVQAVVLGSMFGQYLPGSKLIVRRAGADGAEAFAEVAPAESLATEALVRTIVGTRALGRRVVLVAPPPAASGVDFGRCLELRAAGKLILGADRPDCSIDEAKYRAQAAPVHALLRRVSREADVPIFWPDEFLCRDGTCVVELDGVPLYRDTGHLSVVGSRLLGERWRLAERLSKMAR
ncbi:MAG: acyltransferase family protein [Tibeticola sp.]